MFKAIRYDLRYGVMEGFRKYLLAAAFGAFVFVNFFFDSVGQSMYFTGGPWNMREPGLSVGDLIIFELGANFGRTGSSGATSFNFPTLWYISILLPCYMTLTLASDDISAGGVQIMSRLQRRGKWWLSKCVLCAVSVVLYYLTLYAATWVICVTAGFESSIVPEETIFNSVFGVMFIASETTPTALFVSLIIQPCLVATALSLVELTITLFVKPVYAFIAVAAYLAASTLIISPAFLGSFAMPIRSSAIGVYNFDFPSCLLICVTLSAIAILAGRWKIIKTDIL